MAPSAPATAGGGSPFGSDASGVLSSTLMPSDAVGRISKAHVNTSPSGIVVELKPMMPTRRRSVVPEITATALINILSAAEPGPIAGLIVHDAGADSTGRTWLLS